MFQLFTWKLFQVSANNRRNKNEILEMGNRQFSTITELLTKLKDDLTLSFPSFIREFIGDPNDGVTHLLDALKAIQLAQSNITGKDEKFCEWSRKFRIIRFMSSWKFPFFSKLPLPWFDDTCHCHFLRMMTFTLNAGSQWFIHYVTLKLHADLLGWRPKPSPKYCHISSQCRLLRNESRSAKGPKVIQTRTVLHK